MENEQLGQAGNVWPEYFQPRSGQESIIPVKKGARIATSLLDIFYLRSGDSEPASLVAVVGCMGGEIDVVSGGNVDMLPDDVKEHVQFLHINQRDRFRLIVARSIDIFRLDALKHNISGKGFNDAVQLFGSMQARVSYHRGQASITLVENEGRIAVGKLDLLQSIREGIVNQIIQSKHENTKTYHMLIATGRTLEVQEGKSLALVYPLADSDIGDVADNEAIVRQVVYNLLLSLQSDMLQSGIRIPFTEYRFPVPNRAQFVESLKEEGYEIRGNAAYKTDANRKPRSKTFLGQLRQSAESWFAPVVGLPHEATLDEYAALIDEGLSHVVTSDDQEAMDAVASRTFNMFVPPAEQKKKHFGSQPTFEFEATAVQPKDTVSALPVRTTALPPPAATEPADWADDFIAMPRQPSPAPIPHHHWWDDFAHEDDARSTVTTTMHDTLSTTRQTETEDFDIGTSTLQHPGFSEGGHEVSPSEHSAHADDFRKMPQGRDKKEPNTDPDWENDFR